MFDYIFQKSFNIKILRIFIGLAFIGLCIAFLGWWGLFGLLVALPFIGWKDRHKGPFNVKKKQYTNFEIASNIEKEAPMSNRLLQDILVEAQHDSVQSSELIQMLKELLICLRKEYTNRDDYTDEILLCRFVVDFSDAYPNWENEYSRLGHLIEQNF